MAAAPRSFTQDKVVLELGCGCGLPGLTAACLGVRAVLLTDTELDNARFNVRINEEARWCLPDVRACDWRDRGSWPAECSIDLVARCLAKNTDFGNNLVVDFFDYESQTTQL